MSAKRFTSPGVMIVLLAITLVGCATTSSEVSKPHRPQMITSEGPEEVGTSETSKKFANGFNLSDAWASVLTAMRPVFEFFGSFANR